MEADRVLQGAKPVEKPHRKPRSVWRYRSRRNNSIRPFRTATMVDSIPCRVGPASTMKNSSIWFANVRAVGPMAKSIRARRSNGESNGMIHRQRVRANANSYRIETRRNNFKRFSTRQDKRKRSGPNCAVSRSGRADHGRPVSQARSKWTMSGSKRGRSFASKILATVSLPAHRPSPPTVSVGNDDVRSQQLCCAGRGLRALLGRARRNDLCHGTRCASTASVCFFRKA